jgi:cell volume regulation protein A
VAEAERVYTIVFAVVTFSVLVQGTTIPLAAARFGVPMRTSEASR